jgi:hypothetical protein
MPEELDLPTATVLVQAGVVRVQLDCLHLTQTQHFKMAVMVALDFVQPLQAQEFSTLAAAVVVRVG